jgi:hypothetical protein
MGTREGQGMDRIIKKSFFVRRFDGFGDNNIQGAVIT